MMYGPLRRKRLINFVKMNPSVLGVRNTKRMRRIPRSAHAKKNSTGKADVSILFCYGYYLVFVCVICVYVRVMSGL